MPGLPADARADLTLAVGSETHRQVYSSCTLASALLYINRDSVDSADEISHCKDLTEIGAISEIKIDI
ncbi:hypothetical protein FJMB80151_36020 [Enterobacter hormaechei]|jgi:hypothetical protein|nr:hypothetical protein SL264_11860 [Enterobacter cloacae]BCZ61406.1 hypothetical protein SL269_11900 [Klebsiella aerogenes]BDK26881.1 hypothetical protein FJMB80063_35600 [Enterobacter hormaechei]BDK31933.1 hypothetical protein FJMB80068_34970 [Enterobacter hormaechei]BDK37090.1 hypothetical protein FJMB80144_36010 [Enterobacter hormaechei]